jgi:uncharacterized NAD(P)/FAD-binding protein YdhS
MSDRRTRVVIVGGGAGGVITAAALARSAAAIPLDVRIVERTHLTGPGLAYRTADPSLLLNNYAGRMSAVPDDPDDLLRWCAAAGVEATADTFLPRKVYGRYLTDLLARMPTQPGSRVWRIRGEAVDLDETDSGYLVSTANGLRLHGDVVVLALGNPPPRSLAWMGVDKSVLFDDPWDPALVQRIGARARVLLVGTGLTMVDVAAQIADARPDVRLAAASRHGVLPQPHRSVDRGPAAPYTGEGSLRAILAEVRTAAREGQDWRSVVEAVKGVGNDLWKGLDAAERSRFQRHVARYWEVARHRMAPAMATVIDDLVASGRLRVTTSDAVNPADFDHVVNCTGPAPLTTPGWNPLVDNLRGKGMLREGPLGLGADIDSDGALIDSRGLPALNLFLVGAARRGVEWEVASVPDLRRQATAIAQRVAIPALDGLAG